VADATEGSDERSIDSSEEGRYRLGVALTGIGSLMAALDVHYAQLLALLIVAGVGISIAIPAAQNSGVGSVALEAIGKAAGANSMMRELGGVFGIAVVVSVFAATGGYASAAAFTDGFAPAIGVSAGLALAGAIAALALPRRGTATATSPEHAVPALEVEVTTSRGGQQ
jgi:MFS family permease